LPRGLRAVHPAVVGRFSSTGMVREGTSRPIG